MVVKPEVVGATRGLPIMGRRGLELAVSPSNSSSAVQRHARHTLDALITCRTHRCRNKV
jgi:hypothetical protein